VDSEPNETLHPGLSRYDQGERKVWSVVTVPGVAEEDQRQLHRNLKDLRWHRTECGHRILGLLASQGIASVVDATIRERLPIS
jgi:transposase